MSKFSDLVIADTPLLYLRCEELSGTTLADASGNGNPGSISGAYTLGAPGMSAQTGNGIGFTSGMIKVPHKAALNMAGDYAIELIARFTGSGYQHVFNKVDAASPFKGPWIYANYNSQTNAQINGAVSFRQAIGTNNAVSVGGTSGLMLNDGVYRHYFFVRRGLSLEIHVNGTMMGSATVPSLSNCTTSTNLCVMNYDQASSPVSGSVDEIAYYGYAPSIASIAKHAAYAADKSRIAGVAKLDTGVAASAVVARDWATRALLGQTIPATDGSFEIYVPSGKCDVTVFGPAGYQPITHGPIDAVVIA